jgi:hypothetical protein
MPNSSNKYCPLIKKMRIIIFILVIAVVTILSLKIKHTYTIPLTYNTLLLQKKIIKNE